MNFPPPRCFSQFEFSRKNIVPLFAFCVVFIIFYTYTLNTHSLWCGSTVWSFAAKNHHHREVDRVLHRSVILLYMFSFWYCISSFYFSLLWLRARVVVMYVYQTQTLYPYVGTLLYMRFGLLPLEGSLFCILCILVMFSCQIRVYISRLYIFVY